DPGTRGWCSSRPARNPGRAEWLPQGARVGWLDGQDLFLDIDSAYGVARAAAAGVDGLAVGSQTLIKRLHESGRLKSIDERREKLKIRRVIAGRRLEGSISLCRRAGAFHRGKNRPNRPIDRREE